MYTEKLKKKKKKKNPNSEMEMITCDSLLLLLCSINKD